MHECAGMIPPHERGYFSAVKDVNANALEY